MKNIGGNTQVSITDIVNQLNLDIKEDITSKKLIYGLNLSDSRDDGVGWRLTRRYAEAYAIVKDKIQNESLPESLINYIHKEAENIVNPAYVSLVKDLSKEYIDSEDSSEILLKRVLKGNKLDKQPNCNTNSIERSNVREAFDHIFEVIKENETEGYKERADEEARYKIWCEFDFKYDKLKESEKEKWANDLVKKCEKLMSLYVGLKGVNKNYVEERANEIKNAIHYAMEDIPIGEERSRYQELRLMTLDGFLNKYRKDLPRNKKVLSGEDELEMLLAGVEK